MKELLQAILLVMQDINKAKSEKNSRFALTETAIKARIEKIDEAVVERFKPVPPATSMKGNVSGKKRRVSRKG